MTYTPGPPTDSSGEPVAGFSPRELFTNATVLAASYTGALLLLVATLLFEIYGTHGSVGGLRFGAVALLNAAFGVAGWRMLRSSRLRLVGKTYVALAALMLPLTMLASYAFLSFRSSGITPESAVALAAALCAGVYTLLSISLRSVVYGTLATVALTIAAGASMSAVDAGGYSGSGLALVALVFASAPRWSRHLEGVARPAGVILHAIAPIAILWPFAATLRSLSALFPGTAYPVPVNALAAGAALAVVTVAYVAHAVATRSLSLAWIPALTGLASALFLNAAFPLAAARSPMVIAFGAGAFAIVVTLAVGMERGVREFFDVGVSVLALMAFLPSSHPAVTAAAVTIAGAVCAFRFYAGVRSRIWFTVPAISFAGAWAWTVAAAIEAIHPGGAVLGAAFWAWLSPVAVLLLAAALPFAQKQAGRGRLVHQPGSRAVIPFVPAAAVASAIATACVWGLAAAGDLNSVGIVLLVYAAATYACAAVLRLNPVLLLATALSLCASLTLSHAVGLAASSQALVVTALSWLLFVPWPARLSGKSGDDASSVTETHVAIGLAGSAATALFALRAAFTTGAGGGAGAGGHVPWGMIVAGAVATASCATMLFAVSWRSGRTSFAHWGVPVLLLEGIWIARAAGAGNPQLYAISPSAGLIAAGLLMARTRARASGSAAGVQVATAGAALMAATSLTATLQLLAAHRGAPGDTAVLLVEGILWSMLGISLRHRPGQAAGAAAVGVSIVLAMVQLAHALPLFAIFAVVAFLLLASGLAIVLLREHRGTSSLDGR